MKPISVLGAAALLALASAATAETVIFSEDFESYADQAAFEAAYTLADGTGGTTDVPPTLTTDAGNGAEGSDKYLVFETGSPWTASRPLGEDFTPTNEEPVNLVYFIRAADYAGSRFMASVRDSTFGGRIIAIGTTNAPTANVPGGTGDKFAIRLLGYGTIAEAGYLTLTSSPARTPNVWTKLTITAGADTVKTFVDNATTDEFSPSSTPALTANTTTALAAIRLGLGVSTNKDVAMDSMVISKGEISSTSDWDLY